MSPTAHQSEQLNALPTPNFYLTGHDQSTGKAIVQEKRSGQWQAYDDNLMVFNVAYTTSEFPPSLNDDVDIKKHDEVLASGKLGLVNKNGTVCRIVDFAPGFDCMMHRTQSLDYGIVLEGSIELVLDSGETQIVHRGDIVVQRGTMHAWRNTSSSEWARMAFVLQDCQSLVLGDKKLGEDLGRGVDGLPPSLNDS
ncbi:cupin [Fusarium mexicanum]|uniref:Cupin n=1 Tax=Fusarium mexicanum TaxID=751941 RepID=A0A8H5I8B5_9HYPO|nr:cupin [Fusarium mexicanum]